MNAQLKRRLYVVSGIIVIVIVIGLAIIGGSAGYKTISVADALEPSQFDSRVQVSGEVVTDSFTINGDTLEFAIFDPEGNPDEQLTVVYEGGVSSTFGNQVTAICTGLLNANGVLECSELVTKCPSRYETATDALTVSQVLGYGSSVEGKPLKVTGLVKPGSVGTVEASERLVIIDEESGEELPILFDGALPDTITDDAVVVVSGSLNNNQKINATDIALREE